MAAEAIAGVVDQCIPLAGDNEKLSDTLRGAVKIIETNAEAINQAVCARLELPAHTFTACWLLAGASAVVTPDNGQWFIETAIALIEGADKASISGPHFAEVCHKFAELCIAVGHPKTAIRPLRDAIPKLQTTAESLTPIHKSFVMVCLKAKMYHVALPVIEQRLVEVEPKKTGLAPRDILLYFLYSGRVQIGVKNFVAATDCFQQGLTMPCNCVNAIMIESYKKYVLASLLATGSAPVLPKYTSQLVQRHVKNICSIYDQLATAYATNSRTELQKAIDQNIDKIREDGNEGLVKQCLAKMTTGNVARLTQTYVTLSLEDIAKSVELPDAHAAEKKVLDMIAQGQIFARINEADGMVSFLEDPEEYNTNAMMERLDREIRSSAELHAVLSNLNMDLACDHDYIAKTAAKEGSSGGGGGLASRAGNPILGMDPP